MVKVICGNNLKSASFSVVGNTIINERGEQTTMPGSVTLKDICVAAGVDYSRGSMHLDGAVLSPGEMNRTLADFGITSGKCFLLNVVKADNAAEI